MDLPKLPQATLWNKMALHFVRSRSRSTRENEPFSAPIERQNDSQMSPPRVFSQNGAFAELIGQQRLGACGSEKPVDKTSENLQLQTGFVVLCASARKTKCSRRRGRVRRRKPDPARPPRYNSTSKRSPPVPPIPRPLTPFLPMSSRETLGGVVHTYQKYDPVHFPSPTQEPPDLVSPALEHMLMFGERRELTEEELARAIRLDPSQIAGLGPSIDALIAMLQERKRKILATLRNAQASARRPTTPSTRRPPK